jgi:hypothetical protein
LAKTSSVMSPRNTTSLWLIKNSTVPTSTATRTARRTIGLYSKPCDTHRHSATYVLVLNW